MVPSMLVGSDWDPGLLQVPACIQGIDGDQTDRQHACQLASCLLSASTGLGLGQRRPRLAWPHTATS